MNNDLVQSDDLVLKGYTMKHVGKLLGVVTLGFLVVGIAEGSGPTSRPSDAAVSAMQKDNVRMQKEIVDLREQLRQTKVKLATDEKIVAKVNAAAKAAAPAIGGTYPSIGDTRVAVEAWMAKGQIVMSHEAKTARAVVAEYQDNGAGIEHVPHLHGQSLTVTYVDGVVTEIAE